jgi:Zn-dependent peptidase ImmA (M78 family)
MPATGLRRRFAEHLRDRGEKQFSAADLLALARFYEVSLQGMTLRLEDLELLPKGTYDRLRKRNFKPRQAADLLGLTGAHENSPDMFPQRYLRLAFEAFAQSLISEGELARFLHTDRIHARRKYLDWTTQVEEDGKMEVDLREPVIAEASRE